MKKKSQKTNLVSGEILKQIQSCRPLRLFINKQRKKGNEDNPLTIRSKFLQLSPEKKLKYYQKAVDKYTQLLEEKDISEQVQIDGQLFDEVLSKSEQRLYYQSINAPTKPFYSTAAYYTQIKKEENDTNSKPWKSLTADERKPFIQQHNDAKTDYTTQVKNFAESLPERLKAEYLSYINQTQTHPSPSHSNEDNDEHKPSGSITERRKSVQSTTSDHTQKLTRLQLDDLHKYKPSVMYYETKVPDDEKPTFQNSLAKNTHIRSLFNQLSEKKRHKFILKSTKKWEEYLQLNPTIVENQIPTLHLLLGKQDDIYYYFSSLGLPTRPPTSALILHSHEKQQTNSQENWVNLSQTTKDEYIKRLAKIKNEYHQNFLDFVEKTLPSDYMRSEFFRNVKYAAKDYESSTKDRVTVKDEGQLKITQYLTAKKQQDNNDTNEFNRIKQQLLKTQLNNEQKKLVERLGELMNKYIEETTTSKKSSSNSKSSKGASKSASDSSKNQSNSSNDVILINGDISNDNIVHSEDTTTKKKKKHKRDQSEIDESNNTNNNSLSSTTKKRK